MFDGRQCGVVIVLRGQFEQFLRIDQAGLDVGQVLYNVFQAFFLAAQFLGVFGIVPDLRAFQFGIDYLQAFGLGIIVKDTPVALAGARGSRPDGRRVGFGVLLPWCFPIRCVGSVTKYFNPTLSGPRLSEPLSRLRGR